VWGSQGTVCVCCACGREWESDPAIACASPCNSVVMVLGTGASFVEWFVSFAEASIITGTRSGRSCTVVSYTYPPGPAKAGPGEVGSLGGLWGAHPLGSVVGLQEWLGILASFVTGSGAAAGSSISMSSGRAMEVAAKQ